MRPQACFLVVPILKAVVLLLLACGAGDKLRAADDRGGAAADHAKPLAEFLPGTKWLMYARPDRVVEFGADGKFDLADWAKQGIEAVWEVTGPGQVTVTVTSDKFKNLTAVFEFSKNRTSFTGHDLDKDRTITISPRVGHEDHRPPAVAMRELTEALGDTKWLWHNMPDRVLELRKGGRFDLDDWKQQRITAVWKATGPNEVTVTVTSQKFHNLTALLEFDEDHTWFTGHDLDRKRKIEKSPRVDADAR